MVPTGAVSLPLGPPRVFHLPNWGKVGEAGRIKLLREIAASNGRDPRVRELAFRILAEAGLQQRDYRGQAAAILRWVQQNIAYVNEPGEVLQDPLYTVRIKAGDCDDMAILLASLYEAIRLPWAYVLAGKGPAGEKVRWVEGGPPPSEAVQWGHIYVRVRLAPYDPRGPWVFVEPTIKDAPLGWDVFQPRSAAGLPELSGPTGYSGAFALVPAAGGAAGGFSLFGETVTWGRFATAVLTAVAATLAGKVALDLYERRRRGR